MRLLTSREMREIDEAARKQFYLPVAILMENAGIAVADHLLSTLATYSKQLNVLILVGPGNNGGDGLVAARQLKTIGVENLHVLLLVSPQKLKGSSKDNYKRAKAAGVDIINAVTPAAIKKHKDKIKKASVVVDAMLGTGVTREVTGVIKEAIDIINERKGGVIAVDIPSGICADSGSVMGTAVKAESTITFGLPKVGLYVYPGREYSGDIEVSRISLPAELLGDRGWINLITASIVADILPTRSPSGHKGNSGHLLDIVGSPGKPGAAILSSLGAFRIGAGLVTTASDSSVRSAIAAKQPEIMTESFPRNINEWNNLVSGKRCVAFGPGIEPDSSMIPMLEWVLRSAQPVVLDAGGLTLLSQNPLLFKYLKKSSVLTPHPGEMSRLTGIPVKEIQSNRVEITRKFARKWGVTLVLKGAGTIVASSNGDVWVNSTGNVALATAGTGDVLTGMISGLITQGVKSQDAAIAAVYLHGLLGDRLKEEKGERGVVATDLLEELPNLISDLTRLT